MSYNHPFIRGLKHPSVRDLSFLLGSAPLVQIASEHWPDSDWFQTLWQDYLPVLKRLDKEPQPLIDWLNETRPMRLGIYAERLWHFYLNTSERFQLLSHNLPVRNEKRTLGEFDALVYDRMEHQLLHVEFGCKFFMEIPANDGLHWPGPGLKDSLLDKLNHLKKHQMKLSERPEAKAVLTELGYEGCGIKAFLKGRLFEPLMNQHSMQIPNWVNPKSLDGHWLSLDDLPEAIEGLDEVNILPADRQHWLAGEVPDVSELIEPADWLERCTSNRVKMRNGISRPNFGILYQDGVEVGRWFVVRNDWLSKAVAEAPQPD